LTQAPASRPRPWQVVWALGFRPFFLLAVVSGAVLMALWLSALTGGTPRLLYAYGGGAGWHAHELLSGYTAAVIAGFLLTAVRNWTGQPTLRGVGLALLCLVWLCGRAAAWLPPGGVAAKLSEVACALFLPLVMVAVAIPIVRVRQWRQLGVLVVLAVLTAADWSQHAGVPGRSAIGVGWGAWLALWAVVLLLHLIGGRVIPFFTARALSLQRTRDGRVAIAALIVGHVVFGLATLTGLASGAGLFAAVAGLWTAAWTVRRLVRWWAPAARHHGLLWVLYIGYGALALGYVLAAVTFVAGLPITAAVHAFAVGGIGITTVGMMARVALGHTGRALRADRWLRGAFVLMVLALPVRVIAGMLARSDAVVWIHLAGVLWILAFVVLSVRIAPWLWQPRADGRPDVS